VPKIGEEVLVEIFFVANFVSVQFPGVGVAIFIMDAAEFTDSSGTSDKRDGSSNGLFTDSDALQVSLK